MSLVDPINYFQEHNFTESNVLVVRLHEASNALEFVVAYADINYILARMAPAKGLPEPLKKLYDADLRRLTFSSATHVERRNTTLRNGFLGFDAFDLNIPPHHKMSPTIEFIAIKRTSRSYKARISMGTVGVYHFHFQDLSVEQKLGVGTQVSAKEWAYVDLLTGEPFDFYDPFASL